jgi:hypothetical protein
MTHLNKKLPSFFNLQNEFEWGRDDVNNLCLHINWCRSDIHADSCSNEHLPVIFQQSDLLFNYYGANISGKVSLLCMKKEKIISGILN